MNNGVLVISLDFELLWGIFDKVSYEEKIDYFTETRKVIPKILHLFQQFNIHCTWATVGMLFNENWDEWSENIPEVVPNYQNMNFSAYNYGKKIRSKVTEPLCFAPDLIKMIAQAPGQEIGTHTYSHYYCLEPGQDLPAFKADLQTSIKLAKKFDIELESLVFPRNQINLDYLEICSLDGINNVRSNPTVWYWENTQTDSLAQKIFRTGDAYLGKKDKTYQPSEVSLLDKQLTSQKASRLLRPFSDKRVLNYLKMKRILGEITHAAEKNEIYHLWWHPHNFGVNPVNNLKDLEIILGHFDNCRRTKGMQSLNMAEVGSKALKKIG
ncbi:polysaccharide deacetylase [Antarcticibacterium flavum]|uniref:Polysaccharide deacetylase n=1 Tax=Antarcticibacterium flavum TaxID=2058175 RepID=A0A5B7WZW2_9FLAO|nr:MULTISPECIES: polysaccharide deacetylase family protein [Antarcticibacterium]MCM4158766.1 polysaccharide deacetylase [Antarcticibacterium sp. W02-3]QCY68617.1 polysaccharide deacetylase [Antarcticibacterium flavum]